MLQTLTLHNFKSFENAGVQFSQRQLIIGRNNSGKTNLVSALRFLSATAAMELDRASELVPGGPAEFCCRGLRDQVVEIGCTAAIDCDGEPCSFDYRLSLAVAGDASQSAFLGRLQVQAELLEVESPSVGTVKLLESDGRKVSQWHEGSRGDYVLGGAPQGATLLSQVFDRDTNRRAVLFQSYLKNWGYYAFSPLAIRTGWATGGESRSLSSSGENLANAIFYLKNIDERRYRRLIEHAQIVEPSLEAINFLTAPNQTPVPFVHLSDSPMAAWVGLSDGTLRALALALTIEQAAQCSPPQGAVPALAMIEEPENGLYPGQTRKFFDLFEEWAPSAQFLFTSHSPYFIDMFDCRRDDVILLKKTRNRTELVVPGHSAQADDEEPLTLSTEYALELFQ